MNLRWFEFVILAAVVAICLYLFVPLAAGSRSFFSPDTLESKYQNEWLMWGALDTPLYRSRFKSKESDLVEFLVAEGHWSPRLIGQPRWIETARFNVQWRDGHSFLHRELYWNDEEWIEWSKSNPDQAASMWPHVLALLRSSPYDESKVVELIWNTRYEDSMAEK